MDEKFLTGVLLGMLGGALIIGNSVKARKALKDGQDMVMDAVTDMYDKTKSKAKSTQSKSKSKS